MNELKPCPFCGGEATITAVKINGVVSSYHVGCQNYDCAVEPETYSFSSEVEAVEAWNRRAGDEA